MGFEPSSAWIQNLHTVLLSYQAASVRCQKIKRVSKLETNRGLNRKRKSDSHGWTLQISDHFTPSHAAHPEDRVEDTELTPCQARASGVFNFLGESWSWLLEERQIIAGERSGFCETQNNISLLAWGWQSRKYPWPTPTPKNFHLEAARLNLVFPFYLHSSMRRTQEDQSICYIPAEINP